MPLLKQRAPAAPACTGRQPDSTADQIARLRSAGSEAERRTAALDLAAAPDSAEALVAALGRETALAVREAIVTALIEIGSEPAIGGLARFLASESANLRNAAVEALQQVGAAAGPHIRRALASPNADVRIFAVNVLGALPDPQAPALLRGVIGRDTDVNVGLAAVEIIARTGAASDVALLRDFAGRFPAEPFVRFAVDLACQRVTAGDAA